MIRKIFNEYLIAFRNKKEFTIQLSLDILAIISFALINLIISLIFRIDVRNPEQGLATLFIGTIIYLALVLLAYTYFKQMILIRVRKMVSNDDTRKTWKLLGLNAMIILVPAFAAIIFIFIVSLLIKPVYAARFVEIAAIPILLLYYPFIHLCQMRYQDNRNQAIRRTIKAMKNIKAYYRIYITSAAALTLFLLISGMITMLLRYVIFKDSFVQIYDTYLLVYSIITAMVLLKINAVNRIALMNIHKDEFSDNNPKSQA